MKILRPVLLLIFVNMSAQNMKPVEQLINVEESAWQFVSQWISAATNQVEILPADPISAKDALYKTQVTTSSPMGAIVYNTGGLLIDNGWIRILGSGSSGLRRSLPDWNKGKSFKEFGEAPAFLLVADDASGGFFLINGGGLGTDIGKIYYLAADSLEYEPLDVTYSDFLMFCFNSDLDDFYDGLRWNSWKEDILEIDGDQVYSFYPYLWTTEGNDINTVARVKVTAEEQYNVNMQFRKKLKLE